MKIALISSTFLPSHDGVSITLFERLKKLSAAGHSALCLVSSYSELKDIYPNWSDYVGCIFKNIEVVPLPSKQWMGVKQERNPTRNSIPIIHHALTKFQPDIIHVDEPERLWTTMFVLPGLFYAKQHNIPCIASYRTNFIDYIQDYAPWWIVNLSKSAVLLLTQWIYNQYSTTLVGSQFIYQRLKLWGIKNVDYAQVIGPPLVQNPEIMRTPKFFQDFYGLSDVDDTVKILFLGRLSPDKNWEFNCKYLPELKYQLGIKKCKIIIAGRGELEDFLLSSSLTKELSPAMLGEVPHDRVSHLLANVDIHVTSSLKETFGRTVQESLYVGTPVVAPDCDWTRNLITPNVNGVLYQPQDGKDFIEKLTKIINQPSDLTKLRTNILLSHAKMSSKSDPASNWIEYLYKQI
ncbi:glycosyltransferase [Calothrix rhizosoleniae]|uniref:glycosyltransferase n=1 Tax=Calothrix rhizosoleniae TaxID=888997 RepID=UPI000B499616|nr:glycosyltransferase [Calothrix rhizosoleniae]